MRVAPAPFPATGEADTAGELGEGARLAAASFRLRPVVIDQWLISVSMSTWFTPATKYKV